MRSDGIMGCFTQKCGHFMQTFNYLNQLGWLITGVDLLAQNVLSVSALTAALLWARPRWSRRVLGGSWVTAGIVLSLVYLFTKRVAGIHVVGFDPDESSAHPVICFRLSTTA
jgi:hypothetical protein